MEMQESRFSRPAAEVSCIIGNLFAALQPPCDELGTGDSIVICGLTHSKNYGRLTIQSDRCVFYGYPEDIEAVLNGRCPERKCENG